MIQINTNFLRTPVTAQFPDSMERLHLTSLLFSLFPDTSPLLASMTSLSWPLPGLSLLLYSRILLINPLVKGWDSQSSVLAGFCPPSAPRLAWVAVVTPTPTATYRLIPGLQIGVFKLVLFSKLLKLSIIKSKYFIFPPKPYSLPCTP